MQYEFAAVRKVPQTIKRSKEKHCRYLNFKKHNGKVSSIFYLGHMRADLHDLMKRLINLIL